jgi:enoyl-CoA hydratase/carnithine racemase
LETPRDDAAMIRSTAVDGLRVVTLDAPERANALTRDGLDALRDAVTDADESVLYLRGAGEAFCAGADLDTVDELSGADAAAFARRGQRVARALAGFDGATVAGVDGAARGGAVDLALACDLRLATPAATVAASGVTIGLLGAWGGTARLPRVVGQGVALDLALTGRVLDAEAALRTGLVSRVTETPRTVAETVAEHDPAAVRAVMRCVRGAGPREDRERREAAAFADLVANRNG